MEENVENQSIVFENNTPSKKSKTLLIIVVALAILAAGVIVYLIMSSRSDSSTTEQNDQGKSALDIINPLVTNLVYPSNSDPWVYKSTNTQQIGRKDMMRFASKHLIETVDSSDWPLGKCNGFGGSLIPKSEMESSFKRVFGPDAEYRDGNVFPEDDCHLKYYEADNGYFWAAIGRYADYEWANETKLYKAEQEGDYIYTYFYVQPYIEEKAVCNPSSTEDLNIYLYKRQLIGDNDPLAKRSTTMCEPISTDGSVTKAKKSELPSIMTSGNIDTYKFTFKKQSDGNYYFFSGDWL